MSFTRTSKSFSSAGARACSRQQRKVLGAIGRCRTAVLGSHLERCDSCSYEYVAFDSCRDRHCPKVPVDCSRSLAAEAGVESAARALQPCLLHAAQATGSTRTQKPASYLRSAISVSETLMEIAADRPPRCSHRHSRRTPYLESATATSSPPALPGSGRRPGTRPITVDRLSASLLPSRAGAQLHVPWQDAGLPETRLRQPPTALPGTLAALSKPGPFHAMLSTLRHQK